MADEPESDEPDDEPGGIGHNSLARRDRELSRLKSIRDQAFELFQAVRKGFEDQLERSDHALDYWDLYNCRLSQKQVYNGNSQMFVPIVKNAINARRTRFVGKLFPESGNNVEVMSADGKFPFAIMALAEHYVTKARLRTAVFPALSVNGDVEGQYTVYVEWQKTLRHTVRRELRPITVTIEGEDVEAPELGEIEDIIEETIEDGWPEVTPIADSDFLVLPVNAPGIPEAIERGGSVTIRRSWTKAQLRQMIRDGEIVRDAGEALIDAMVSVDRRDRQSVPKKQQAAAGIKSSGGRKYAEGYETWTKLRVDGELRICRAYQCGPDLLLGVKLNPYWCDRVPILSCPVEKAAGSFKGVAPMKAVEDMQIAANDTANEGADTFHFSAMPIVMSDPEKNPGAMILGLAAIWKVDPNSTKLLEFPPLFRFCIEQIANYTQMINQTLGVNPAMMPQSTGKPGMKRNQAEIALEQQVDIMTADDAATLIEQEIASPLLQWFIDLDHQFRDKEITIRAYGEMGERAAMEVVPPIVMDARYVYRWNGVEAAKNAARVQQQIAWLNIAKQVPPAMIPGYKINLVPVLVNSALAVFGSRTAPLVVEDLSKSHSLSPEQENELLNEGFHLMPHPDDNDPEHLKSHLADLQTNGDEHGTLRTHIQLHMQQLEAKVMAQAQQMAQQRGPAGPGPQAGAQPQGPKLMRGPPGMINPDRMPAAGAPGQPRRAA